MESPFAALRLRTDAARRYKRVDRAIAVIWKMLMMAEKRFRRLQAPEPSLLNPQVWKNPALTETKSPEASSCPSSRTPFAVSSPSPAPTESFRDSVSWDRGSSRGVSEPNGSPAAAPSSPAYLPFGAGCHRCAGAGLAEVIVWLFVTRMLRRLSFRTSEGLQSEYEVLGTYLQPKSYALLATRRKAFT